MNRRTLCPGIFVLLEWAVVVALAVMASGCAAGAGTGPTEAATPKPPTPGTANGVSLVNGPTEVRVDLRYGGAISYLADARLGGGNMVDNSNGGTLFTTAIWLLPLDAAELTRCYPAQRVNGSCPGSLPFRNPTQGGYYAAGHAGNPQATVTAKDGALSVSYRAVNYNFGYNDQGRVPALTVENAADWQTDFWGDVVIRFARSPEDVLVITTRITYCKNMAPECAAKRAVTQDNQLSTFFGKGQSHPDPAERGPWTRAVNGAGWAGVFREDDAGVGIRVAGYRPVDSRRFGIVTGPWPFVTAIQPDLRAFESSGVTATTAPVVNGHVYDDGLLRFEFEPGGWYEFSTYLATGTKAKIDADLLEVKP